MDFAETIRGIFGGQSSQPPPSGDDYAAPLRPMVEPAASRRPKLSLSIPKPPEQPERDEVLGDELHKILADSASEAAALRTRESVRPTGGRQEGGATRLIEKLPGAMIAAPFRAIGQGADAMRRVAYGELDPMSPEGVGEGVSAAMNVLGGAPFARRNTLGAGGGKMVQPKASEAATGGVEDMIKAYHGSPHDFDRFDLSKIGTGEGAQAYGHGLYFAENPAIAKSYREKLAGGDIEKVRADEEALASIKPKWDEIVGKLREARAKSNERPTEETMALQNHLDALNDHAVADTLARKPWLKEGRMYEVGIRANPEHFLDWDKPVSEQHHVMQRLPAEFQDQMRGAEAPTGEAMMRRVARPSFPIRDNSQSPWKASNAKTYEEALEMVGGDKSRVNRMLTPDPQYATQALREAGIPGIKYLDQGSRGKGDGTRNFVVFDDKLIDILKKYGIAGIGALPAMNAFHYQDKQ